MTWHLTLLLTYSFLVFRLVFRFVRTFALGVLATTVLPFAPAFFFFRAVAARSERERLLAFPAGKQRSGFFLSLLVPQGPLIFPSVPIRTQFCLSHFFNSPITCPYVTYRSLALSLHLLLFCEESLSCRLCSHPNLGTTLNNSLVPLNG